MVKLYVDDEHAVDCVSSPARLTVVLVSQPPLSVRFPLDVYGLLDGLVMVGADGVEVSRIHVGVASADNTSVTTSCWEIEKLYVPSELLFIVYVNADEAQVYVRLPPVTSPAVTSPPRMTVLSVTQVPFIVSDDPLE